MNIYILLDFQPASEYIPHPVTKLILVCVRARWKYDKWNMNEAMNI